MIGELCSLGRSNVMKQEPSLYNVKNMVWDYFYIYKNRNKKILIEDLKNVILYIETLIKTLGG